MKYCSFIENESIILLLVNIYCKSLVNDEKDTRFNCGDPLDCGDSALLKKLARGMAYSNRTIENGPES